MNLKVKKISIAVLVNALGLVAISVLLMIAFYFQLIRSDLPCPLCLLQRIGLVIIGLGFLFNITLGLRSSHFAMIIIGCIVTAIIASRQIFLHIQLGDTGYGTTLFTLHFYTWSAITSIYFLFLTAFALLLSDLSIDFIETRAMTIAMNLLSFIFIVLVLVNMLSIIVEYGSGQCADNTVLYKLFSDDDICTGDSSIQLKNKICTAVHDAIQKDIDE